MNLKVVLFLLIPFFSFSQSIEKKKSEFLALPNLGYSPETSLLLGVSGFYNTIWEAQKQTNKVSSHTFYAQYTLKKQMSFGIRSDNWLGTNKHHFYLSWDYNKYPFLFYPSNSNSAKSEKYTTKFFNGLVRYERLIAKNLYVGVQLETRIEKIVEVEKGKLLASKSIIGSDKFNILGIAPTLIYDTRDNTLYPTNGDLYQVKIRHFNKLLSNQNSFTLYDLDLRKYLILNKYDHILAINFSYQFSDNKNIPFQMLPSVGNEYIQRGYYEGRYRSTNRMVLKSAYRLPINHRFKMAVFGSVSSVDSSFRKLFTSTLHPACGIGLRYRLGNNGMHIRIDMTYGMKFSPYVNAGEAF